VSADLDCPRCSKPLQTGATKKLCGSCGGAFLLRKNISDLLESIRAGRATDALASSPYRSMFQTTETVKQEARIRYLPCPCCGDLMNRTELIVSSQIVVDMCVTDGVWFDAGEIRHATEYIRNRRELLGALFVDDIDIVLDRYF
jgi:Zn-finger nucleic acid-binding protein